ISYETFRDKTLPGSQEKWKLKVSGYRSEKVASEMLVSMYDASLDQFKPHTWGMPDIWPIYKMPREWNGVSNFTQIQSQEKYVTDGEVKYYVKIYDQIL